MSWFFLILGVVLLGLAFHFDKKWKVCPNCGRELLPEDHHGFHPYERRFCRYCPWDEDKV